MKSCWIIYNGNLGGNKFIDYAEWIADAAKKHGVEPEIISNHELIMLVENNATNIRGKFKNNPDFIVFGDKDIPLAKHLEKIGYKVYNSSESIAICDNKILMYQQLANNGIPIPKTIFGAMIFEGTEFQNYDVFSPISKEIGFPMIIKEAYGSFGQQVYLIQNEQEMIEKIKSLKSRPFLFQEFIQSSYGKDIRLNVVGNRVVASMKRVSQNDFRANVTSGGQTFPYEPTEEEKNLAFKAAKAVGADFAGVDLLFGENGPIVCEVNSNAHIRSIYECTGVNISNYIMEHILTNN